jgi:hypothetical protein
MSHPHDRRQEGIEDVAFGQQGSLDALAARPLSKEHTQAPTLMPMNCKGSLQGACLVQMSFGLVKLHPRL